MTHALDTGKCLRLALAKAHMRQKDFAEKMGMTAAHVSRLATGTQQITGDTLARVAEALDMKPSEFLALGED